MNELNEKLKLYDKEVIHVETFELAAKVCELADKLGLKRISGSSYLDNCDWAYYKENTCYNLIKRGFSNISFYKESGYKITSAVEWLNRHDILVFGQEVFVSPESKENTIKLQRKRIYLHGNYCVLDDDTQCFKGNGNYHVCNWNYIVSPFPEFKLKETIEFNGKKYYKEDIEKAINFIKPIDNE